jgi:hypothetical protein
MYMITLCIPKMTTMNIPTISKRTEILNRKTPCSYGHVFALYRLYST